MFKKFLIFVGGLWLGSYATYNHLYKKVVKVALEPKDTTEDKKDKDSETKQS